MPFHFRSQRQVAAARRRQYILAFIALGLVLAVVVCWLATRYYLSMADKEPAESAASSAPVTEVADTASSLLIINERGKERFVLIQFRPAENKAYTLSLPAATDCGNGQSLAAVLRKSGSPLAAEQASKVLGLPISHYLTLTIEQIETYVNYLEGGVSLNLPEAVTYINDSLVEAVLPAGTQQLAANQVGDLLRYDGWSDPQQSHTVAAAFVAAVLNQYMQPEHRFGGDFAYLANLMLSDIRIDHYNAYADTLSALADSNGDGNLCEPLTVQGETQNGLFLPNMEQLRQTALYD